MPACCVMNRQVAREKARRPSGAAGVGGGGVQRYVSAWCRKGRGQEAQLPENTCRLCAARQDSWLLRWEATTSTGPAPRSLAAADATQAGPASSAASRQIGSQPNPSAAEACLGSQCPGAQRRGCSGRWSVKGQGSGPRLCSVASYLKRRGFPCGRAVPPPAANRSRGGTHVPPHQLGDAVHAVDHHGLWGGAGGRQRERSWGGRRRGAGLRQRPVAAPPGGTCWGGLPSRSPLTRPFARSLPLPFSPW